MSRSSKDQHFLQRRCKRRAFHHLGVAVWQPWGVVIAASDNEFSLSIRAISYSCCSAFNWSSFARWPLHDATQSHLTNRWSQPLAVVKSMFEFMKPFSMFAVLAAASGGSAPSR